MTERLTEPYEVLVTRDDDRLVEVTIRAVGDGAVLTPAILAAAQRDLQARLRAEDYRAERLAAAGPLTDSLRALRNVWAHAGGDISPKYLASLAAAYAELAATPGHGSITLALADAIGRPPATVKGHILRARKEGFLTPVGPGQTGGSATKDALKVLAQIDESGR